MPTVGSRDIRRIDPRRWVLFDASGQVLGRLAARVAAVLRGKDKPAFTPHIDGGDFVVVINAEKIRLTGRKLQQKRHFRHSGYPGGLREVTYERLMQTHPERVIEYAVRGMLPNTPLGRKMFAKLKVYRGSEHPHTAQRPVPVGVEESLARVHPQKPPESEPRVLERMAEQQDAVPGEKATAIKPASRPAAGKKPSASGKEPSGGSQERRLR